METFDELYYTKPYLREFDGKVVSCEAADGGFAIVLDQTAFYPTGGGQPGDRGTLRVGTGDDILVAHVREAVPGNGAGEVIHLTDVTLPVGASVHGSLDWTWRRDNMRRTPASTLSRASCTRSLATTTWAFTWASVASRSTLTAS